MIHYVAVVLGVYFFLARVNLDRPFATDFSQACFTVLPCQTYSYHLYCCHPSISSQIYCTAHIVDRNILYNILRSYNKYNCISWSINIQIYHNVIFCSCRNSIWGGQQIFYPFTLTDSFVTFTICCPAQILFGKTKGWTSLGKNVVWHLVLWDHNT